MSDNTNIYGGPPVFPYITLQQKFLLYGNNALDFLCLSFFFVLGIPPSKDDPGCSGGSYKWLKWVDGYKSNVDIMTLLKCS